MGFNRHESAEGHRSLPELERDMALLLESGANFIRGAHYPQDARWLDLCDEYGVVVWEEALGWQNTLADLGDPAFFQGQLTQLRSLLQHSASHPSVVLVGFLNEMLHAGDERAAPYYERLAGYVRALDPTRLVTWASSVTLRDRTLAYADVISFNDYSGWYPTPEPASWAK